MAPKTKAPPAKVSPAKAAPSTKASPGAKKKSKAEEAEPSDGGSFSCARLAANLIALGAMMVLVADVVLGHQHSIMMGIAAAGLILCSAVINAITGACCGAPAAQAAVARSASADAQ